MLKSNSSTALKNLRGYIVSNTDFEVYGFKQSEDWKDCGKYIMTAFYSEKVEHDKRKIPYQDLFVEWLSGLPSVFDSCYYYNRSAVDDLGMILEETEEEKARFDERKAEQTLSWLIYREVLKACNYQIKKFMEV